MFCLSKTISSVFLQDHWPDLQGSDHAPVWADLVLPAGELPTGLGPVAASSQHLFDTGESRVRDHVHWGGGVKVPKTGSTKYNCHEVLNGLHFANNTGSSLLHCLHSALIMLR